MNVSFSRRLKGSLVLASGWLLASPAIAAPPVWWTTYGVTDGAAANSYGPANVGQLKWTARCAWTELNSFFPGGPGFTLQSVVPDPAATPTESELTVANLGQLKYVAKPFYDRLLLLAPTWVAAEYQRNGLTGWTLDYPWDPATPVATNYQVANVGQLKLVFSLRFKESFDGDTIPDLLEYVFYGNTAGDGTTTDYDKDGKTDAQEIAAGTRLDLADTDGDGIPDGLDSNPLSPDSTSSPAVALVVWTTLEN